MRTTGEIIHRGTKVFWKVRSTVDLYVIEYQPFDMLEIICYDPVMRHMCARIFVRQPVVHSRIRIGNEDELENINDGGYFQRHGMSRNKVVNFIATHLQIKSYNPKSKIFNIELLEQLSDEVELNREELMAFIPPVSLVPIVLDLPGYSASADAIHNLHNNQLSSETAPSVHLQDFLDAHQNHHEFFRLPGTESGPAETEPTHNGTFKQTVTHASAVVSPNQSQQNTPRTLAAKGASAAQPAVDSTTRRGIRSLQSIHNTYNAQAAESNFGKRILTSHPITSHYSTSVVPTTASTLPLSTHSTTATSPSLPPYSHLHLTPHKVLLVPEGMVKYTPKRSKNKHRKKTIPARLGHMVNSFFGMFQKHARVVVGAEKSAQQDVSPHTPHDPELDAVVGGRTTLHDVNSAQGEASPSRVAYKEPRSIGGVPPHAVVPVNARTGNDRDRDRNYCKTHAGSHHPSHVTHYR